MGARSRHENPFCTTARRLPCSRVMTGGAVRVYHAGAGLEAMGRHARVAADAARLRIPTRSAMRLRHVNTSRCLLRGFFVSSCLRDCISQLYFVSVFFVVSSLLLAAVLAQTTRDADWPMHGGLDNIRYSSLAQINRDNVTTLQVAWTYDSHDAFKGSEMQSNPVVVGGTLYATTPMLKVIALDAATGREIWKFDPGGGATGAARFRHRGVTVDKDRVFVTYRSFLWALDRTTGTPIASFGANGRVDLREGLDQPAA